MEIVYHNNKPVLVVDPNEEFQFRLDYGMTATFYTAKGSELTDREKNTLIAEYELRGRRKKAEYPLMPGECFTNEFGQETIITKTSGQSESCTTTEYIDVKTPEEASNQYRALERMAEFDRAMKMTPEEFAKNYTMVKRNRR